MSRRQPLAGSVRGARAGESSGQVFARPAASSALDLRLEVLPAVLAVLSATAAAIHFAVAPSHAREHWLFGAFFVLAGLFQAGWAVLASRKGSPLLYGAGAAGNAALVGSWVVSRTAGLPFGPHAGQPEPPGFVDGLATVYEVLIVAGALALTRLALPSRAARSRARLFRVWPLVALVLPLTAASLAVPGGVTHEHAGAAVHGLGSMGHHLFHLFVVGAAAVVFASYVAVDIRRRGRPAFSWRLKQVDGGAR